MRPFRILHIEEDLECNFLLSEALRREKHITVTWAFNRDQAYKFLSEQSFDLIVCAGIVLSWKHPYKEVLRWSKGKPVILYATKCDTLSTEFIDCGGVKAFPKSSEGTNKIVGYIKKISKKETSP